MCSNTNSLRVLYLVCQVDNHVVELGIVQAVVDVLLGPLVGREQLVQLWKDRILGPGRKKKMAKKMVI